MKFGEEAPPRVQRPTLQTLAAFPTQTCSKRYLKLTYATFYIQNSGLHMASHKVVWVTVYYFVGAIENLL